MRGDLLLGFGKRQGRLMDVGLLSVHVVFQLAWEAGLERRVEHDDRLPAVDFDGPLRVAELVEADARLDADLDRWLAGAFCAVKRQPVNRGVGVGRVVGDADVADRVPVQGFQLQHVCTSFGAARALFRILGAVGDPVRGANSAGFVRATPPDSEFVFG